MLDEPTEVVSENFTLSAPSSQPINTLAEPPLSIINPESASAAGVPVAPFESSISLSEITRFVVSTVVVVPVTFKFGTTRVPELGL